MPDCSGGNVAQGADSSRLIGRSAVMCALREQARLAARFDEPVLIVGETGTGKELLAHYLHAHGPRGSRPLQTIHCAGLGADVLAAELFGHVAGAFTGASRDRAGRIRAADGSTVLLDELSETPQEFQAALLRVLEYGEIQPVGQDRPVRVDVRFVATSNRPLEHLSAGRGFRTDLYHRLAAFVLRIPALRERQEDIPELAEHFLETFAERYGAARKFSPGALVLLAGQRFPGNVRELRQAVLRAFAGCAEPTIGPEHVARALQDPCAPEPAANSASLEGVVRRHIRQTLRVAGGNLSQAARLLDIPRSTLQHYLVKYRVEPPERADRARRTAT